MHKKISIHRDYLYCPKCKKGHFQLDQYLDIENKEYSPDFAFAVAHFTAITDSFKDCGNTFKYAQLSNPSVSFIQKVANDIGSIGVEEEDHLLESGAVKAMKMGENKKNDIFTVMLDGGRCLLKEKDIKIPQWREVKVGAFVNYHTEKDENGEPTPIRDKTNYIGRIGEKSEIFGERLWLEALKQGYQNSNKNVFIADGAKYNWEIWEHYFSKATPILDWYHATEHLADCAKIIFKDDIALYNDWFEERKKELYNNEIKKIYKAIKIKFKLSKNKDNAKKLKREMGYFFRNRHRTNYKRYKELGLPIGSGVIEGGIKQLVNKRIKGTEKHWLLKNGNNILKIRIDEVANNLAHLCDLYEKVA